MRILLATLAILALAIPAGADELTLKDGRRIPFRVLKDVGDCVEVQTVDNQTVTVKKGDVKEVSLVAPAAPLAGAAFVGDNAKAAQKPVNLLAALDPKKHGIVGEWRASGGAIVGGGIGVLEIPYIPASPAYDIEIALERKDGDDEVVLGLIAAGKPFGVTVDWGKGQASGLTCISGVRIFENESKVPGRQLVTRKPSLIKCAVREGRVVVLVDGKTLIDWTGDVKQLSFPGRTKEPNLWLGTHNTTVAITRYVFTARQ